MNETSTPSQPDPTQAPEPMTRPQLLERLVKHLTGTAMLIEDGFDAVESFALMRQMVDETARAWGEARE